MSKKQTVINAAAHTVYGRGLWEKLALVAEGTCVNNFKKPLGPDDDMRKLKPNSLYYQRNRYGDIQVVLVYEDGAWSYCGLVRDKSGEPVTSDNNTYQIYDVKARNRFEIKDADGNVVLNDKGEPAVIDAGYITSKAYAVVED